MIAQSVNDQTSTMRKELAIFDNLKLAQDAKKSLETSDITFQSLDIEGDINFYEEVSAMGTTTGAEAGLLTGAFIGGTLGVIFISIFSTLVYGELANTSTNRLAIAAFTVAGSLIGVIAGKQIRAASSAKQKQKGNPSVPRRFKLIAEGSEGNIARAEDMLTGA